MILAVEDGCFTVEGSLLPEALLVGVLMRNNFVEEIFIAKVEVDGLDATDRVLEFMNKAGKLDAVILHGIPYAGFNLVDADRIYKETGVPVLCLLSRKPDMARVKRALRLKFSDWVERVKILDKQGEPIEVRLDEGKVVLSVKGLTLKDALKIVRETIVLGKTPEPLRVARLIASGLPPSLLT